MLGTGDLSELALGWCTYGVGDQMSHYGINAGVPKTLIQFLIRWCIRTGQYDAATDEVLAAIVAAEISPELVPADAAGAVQSTEAAIGPYALNDFFAHYVIRHGLAPSKIAFLAWHALARRRGGDAGPTICRPRRGSPTTCRRSSTGSRRSCRASSASVRFKRSALPNGPKVSAGGALSPRGDWRAPSDGTAQPWLDELRANTP